MQGCHVLASFFFSILPYIYLQLLLCYDIIPANKKWFFFILFRIVMSILLSWQVNNIRSLE